MVLITSMKGLTRCMDNFFFEGGEGLTVITVSKINHLWVINLKYLIFSTLIFNDTREVLVTL